MIKIYKNLSLLLFFYLLTITVNMPLFGKNIKEQLAGKEVRSTVVMNSLSDDDTETNENTLPAFQQPLTSGLVSYLKSLPSDKFYEEWEITSSRTTNGGQLDKQYMLSPESFLKFIDHKHVVLKLNEFYPVQYGQYVQNTIHMKIRLMKDPNCTQCFETMTVSRNTETDHEWLLEFDGHQQLFTVNRIRNTP